VAQVILLAAKASSPYPFIIIPKDNEGYVGYCP
jgi:hypothetical protein